MINTPTKWSTSDCQAAYQKFCTALFCIVLNFAQFCIVFRLICASISFEVITLPCWMLLWGRVHHWWHFLENLPLSSFPSDISETTKSSNQSWKKFSLEAWASCGGRRPTFVGVSSQPAIYTILRVEVKGVKLCLKTLYY